VEERHEGRESVDVVEEWCERCEPLAVVEERHEGRESVDVVEERYERDVSQSPLWRSDTKDVSSQSMWRRSDANDVSHSPLWRSDTKDVSQSKRRSVYTWVNRVFGDGRPLLVCALEILKLN
jgi:hypothetical protein